LLVSLLSRLQLLSLKNAEYRSGGLIPRKPGPALLQSRCARRGPGGFDNLATDDIEMDEPGQRSVPNILEFAPQHVAWLHG
jgi:hypothetical protein